MTQLMPNDKLHYEMGFTDMFVRKVFQCAFIKRT